MFGPLALGWSSGPDKLVGWPLQLKTGTAAVFTCKPFLENKTQRQSHLTLGYFLVQYHFALHPPFKGKQKSKAEFFSDLVFMCNLNFQSPKPSVDKIVTQLIVSTHRSQEQCQLRPCYQMYSKANLHYCGFG